MQSELYSTNPSEYNQYITFNRYVLMACDDVYDLSKMSYLLNEYAPQQKLLIPKDYYFFGNHVINQVRIRGTVSKPIYHKGLRNDDPMCVFSVNDGIGPKPAHCIAKSSSFYLDEIVQEQDYIELWGKIWGLAHTSPTIYVDKVTVYKQSICLKTFFNSQTLAFRNLFLERNAELFKNQRVPNNDLLRLDFLEVIPLRRYLDGLDKIWERDWWPVNENVQTQVIRRWARDF